MTEGFSEHYNCERIHEEGRRRVVAFVMSWLVLFASIAIVFVYAKRREPGTPLLWGEAMVAGTFAFFVMFWAYGVVPHQWLTLADNEWNWRPDRILYGPGEVFKPVDQGGNLPLTITYKTLRDLIATGIYVVLLGAQIAMWAVWQGRADKQTAAAATADVSDYGRPLVKGGAR